MARPTNPGTVQPEPDAELSAAARAVVHDAGDPRIDAHLAALGLGPDPAPATSRRVHAAADDELTVLRDRVAALERELATTITRSNVLAALFAFATLVIVVLAALLVL